MSNHTHHRPHDHPPLTRNQTLVLGRLSQASGPLTAYTILDELRADGFRAPLQVYRALEKLQTLGLVHRLESLNAFVACRHPDCYSLGLTAFAICDACSSVTEFSDDTITQRLTGWAGQEDFRLDKATIELHGRCKACTSH